MDYREYAKDLLARKKNLVSAYASIKCELESLEQEKNACKAAIAKLDQHDGEMTRYDDRLINLLAELDDCRFRRSVVERELLKIEKGLNGLTDYQKEIIDVFFIEHQQYAADDLMDKWHKERSTLYRDRNRALESFTRSVYGVLQL